VSGNRKEVALADLVNQITGTVRYALGSNERTARLAMLMLIAIIAWHVML
jgi:hypothetical protein